MSYHSNVESRTLKIKCELEFEKEMIEFLWGHNTIPRIMCAVFFIAKDTSIQQLLFSSLRLLLFCLQRFRFGCIGFLFCLQRSFFVWSEPFLFAACPLWAIVHLLSLFNIKQSSKIRKKTVLNINLRGKLYIYLTDIWDINKMLF